MKKIIVLVVVAAGLSAWFFIRPGARTVTPPQAELSVDTPNSVAKTRSSGQGSTSTSSASPGTEGTVSSSTRTNFTLVPAKPATPFLLGSADTGPKYEPAVVLDKCRIAIHNYGSMFGGNPVGTNQEITKALNGDNPKEAKFITEDTGLRIDANGELVDSWGTPFFFHQLSATEMEIHSAGPDRIMWTADDLVTK